MRPLRRQMSKIYQVFSNKNCCLSSSAGHNYCWKDDDFLLNSRKRRQPFLNKLFEQQHRKTCLKIVIAISFLFNIYHLIKFVWDPHQGRLIGEQPTLEIGEHLDYMKSVVADTNDEINELMHEIPNIPYNSYSKWKYKGKCQTPPRIFDLRFNNNYWQQTESSNGTFLLYGAYIDNRQLLQVKPVIRILGMINRLNVSLPLYCKIWFINKPPILSKIEFSFAWVSKWGNHAAGLFQPYMLTCPLSGGTIPQSVSVVEEGCNNSTTITNNLRVVYNRKPSTNSQTEMKGENRVRLRSSNGDKMTKTRFAICVKGLNFPNSDVSSRLIEWIELQRVLGVEKIFIYVLEVHSNVRKTLDYYSNLGVVEVSHTSIPGVLGPLQHLFLSKKRTDKRQGEVIHYNDCLYRNMYDFDYLALLDIDEAIIPKTGFGSPKDGMGDWNSLIEKLEDEVDREDVNYSSLIMKKLKKGWKRNLELMTRRHRYATFNFRNVYFFDDASLYKANSTTSTHMTVDFNEINEIPNNFHMLKHVFRSHNYTAKNNYVKCFHDTQKCLILHNHFPLACIGGPCKTYHVPTEIAHLQHYRSNCVNDLKSKCAYFHNQTVFDTSIWQYRSQLIKNVMLVSKSLRLNESV